MSSSNEITYCLIFDTNALFQAYEKKADFTTFSFNSTFENVIDMINQLDIYNQVTVAIPSVVVLSISLETFYSNKNYAARKI